MGKSKSDRLKEWAELIDDVRQTRLKLSYQQLRSAELPRPVRRPVSSFVRFSIRLMSWIERHARDAAKDEVENG